MKRPHVLASAAVSNAAQAALALPMLCFPQVLFGGAITLAVVAALAVRVPPLRRLGRIEAPVQAAAA